MDSIYVYVVIISAFVSEPQDITIAQCIVLNLSQLLFFKHISNKVDGICEHKYMTGDVFFDVTDYI